MPAAVYTCPFLQLIIILGYRGRPYTGHQTGYLGLTPGGSFVSGNKIGWVPVGQDPVKASCFGRGPFLWADEGILKLG